MKRICRLMDGTIPPFAYINTSTVLLNGAFFFTWGLWWWVWWTTRLLRKGLVYGPRQIWHLKVSITKLLGSVKRLLKVAATFLVNTSIFLFRPEMRSEASLAQPSDLLPPPALLCWYWLKWDAVILLTFCELNCSGFFHPIASVLLPYPQWVPASMDLGFFHPIAGALLPPPAQWVR